MCQPASFVLTRDKVFWSRRSDSHEDIIEEFNLHADGVRGSNVVRVEVTPPDGDMRRPLAEWCYHFDQSNTPAWYNAEDGERRARAALAEWHAAKVRVDGVVTIQDAECYAFGNSTVRAYGNSTVTANDNSTVEANDNSTVRAYGNSTVTANDNSTVRANDDSTVEAYDNNSTVRAYGNSTVEAYDNSTVRAYGNSTVEAYGYSTVDAYDNSIVRGCEQYATARIYSQTDLPTPRGAFAVVIDCRSSQAVCVVGEN